MALLGPRTLRFSERCGAQLGPTSLRTQGFRAPISPPSQGPRRHHPQALPLPQYLGELSPQRTHSRLPGGVPGSWSQAQFSCGTQFIILALLQTEESILPPPGPSDLAVEPPPSSSCLPVPLRDPHKSVPLLPSWVPWPSGLSPWLRPHGPAPLPCLEQLPSPLPLALSSLCHTHAKNFLLVLAHPQNPTASIHVSTVIGSIPILQEKLRLRGVQ